MAWLVEEVERFLRKGMLFKRRDGWGGVLWRGCCGGCVS